MSAPRLEPDPIAQVLLRWPLPSRYVAREVGVAHETVNRWRQDAGVPGWTNRDPAALPLAVLRDVKAGKYAAGDPLPDGVRRAPVEAAPKADEPVLTVDERLDERRRAERERAERRADVSELKRLTSAEAAQTAYRQTIAEHAPLLSVPTLERGPALADPPSTTWVLLISDMHRGQKTTSAETGGLFEQTHETTKLQMRQLWQTIERLHGIASKSVRVERIVNLVLGDLHEGDGMRPRQAMEIDESVTRQCVEVTDELAWLFQNQLSLFPTVDVHVVGGNHDRISQKPGLAGLGELAYHDTYAWLAGEFLRRMFTQAQAEDRLHLTNWESFFGTAIIAGQRFVFEHGASFKTSSSSYGGIGWYPIQNAAGRYQKMLDGADIVCMGHFHTAACLPLGRGWQVLNGAWPASSPYVQSSFKTVSTPSQMLLELHPKHGLIDFRPIYLPHAGIAEPGAIWRGLAQAPATVPASVVALPRRSTRVVRAA